MWAALSHELHVASGDWNADVKRRVKTELAPINLSKADWSGDAPFTHFFNPRIPKRFTYPGDGVLVQRVLFKVEAWSAPALGGISRAFLSGDQTGWDTTPQLVVDFAEIDGRPRLVAMHSPCPRCKTTTIGKDGGPCDWVSRQGPARMAWSLMED